MLKNASQTRKRMTWFKTAMLGGLLIGTLQGCGEDPQQLFDTAQFEEQQRNVTHAQELYERIIRDHSESPLATQAQERLQALREAGQ